MELNTIKKKDVSHDIHPLLEARWSPRSFDPEKYLTNEDVSRLFEAARWAPSSYNAQPWEYIFALRQDEKAFQRLLDCLNPGNQKWARNASMLLVAIARTEFEGRDRQNRHAFYDTGQANFALTVQAMSMNLYVHQMGGFDREKTREEFKLPDVKDPVVFMAVGVLASPEQLPEDLRDKERSPSKRKEQGAFLNRLE